MATSTTSSSYHNGGLLLTRPSHRPSGPPRFRGGETMMRDSQQPEAFSRPAELCRSGPQTRPIQENGGSADPPYATSDLKESRCHIRIRIGTSPRKRARDLSHVAKLPQRRVFVNAARLEHSTIRCSGTPFYPFPAYGPGLATWTRGERGGSDRWALTNERRLRAATEHVRFVCGPSRDQADRRSWTATGNTI